MPNTSNTFSTPDASNETESAATSALGYSCAKYSGEYILTNQLPDAPIFRQRGMIARWRKYRRKSRDDSGNRILLY
jgi:hypothetical protein